MMQNNEVRVRGWLVLLVAIVLIAAACLAIVSGLR
jgi:hypothetical protein